MLNTLSEKFVNLNWKRLLGLEHKPVLGLDIGSSAVKIVQLRKDNGEWLATSAGISNISNAGNDEYQQELNTIKAIRDCLKLTEIKDQLAVCGVCGPEVAVRFFKFPSLPTEEIAGAVMLEAEQVCPFNIEDSVVDYQLVSAETKKADADASASINGVLVGVTNQLIKRKCKLARSAHLNSTLMDVDGLALLNCFSECEKAESNQTIAILNIGSSFINLAILGEDGLPFIRDMTYAGNDIIKEIETSEEYKIMHGEHKKLDVKQYVPNREVLGRVCRKVIADISDTLRYYTAQSQSGAVKKIFVCGGFAMFNGLVELLDNELSVEVMLWNPFDKIHCEPGRCEDVLRENGPAMAVAAGLAMRSI